MKPQFFLTCFALALVALLSDCNCKKTGPDTPPKEDPRVALFNKLTGNWKVKEVTLDNTSKTPDYKDFILKIGTDAAKATAKFPFETEKRPNNSVWKDKGELWFKEGSFETVLLRDDDIGDIKYLLADKILTMDFKFNKKEGYPGGRVQSVTGDWRFIFEKQ